MALNKVIAKAKEILIDCQKAYALKPTNPLGSIMTSQEGIIRELEKIQDSYAQVKEVQKVVVEKKKESPKDKETKEG